MKKALLISLITLSTIAAFGQAKKDTAKAKYSYFIRLSPNDIQQFLNLLDDYRNLQTYNPLLTPDKIVSMQKNIDAYKKDLQNRLKIDSVKISK